MQMNLFWLLDARMRREHWPCSHYGIKSNRLEIFDSWPLRPASAIS